MAEAKKKKTTNQTKRKTTKRKVNNNKSKKNINNHSIYIIVNSIVSILLVIFMYIDQSGVVNMAVKNFLLGIFGKTAYIVPLASICTTIYISRTRDVKKYKIKVLLTFILLIILSSIVHLMTKVIVPIDTAYGYGIDLVGGGLFGALLGVGLYTLFKRIASVIILFFAFFILVSVLTKVSIFSAVTSFMQGLFVDMRDEINEIEQIDNYEKGANVKKKAVKKKIEKKQKQAALDLPIEFHDTEALDKIFDEQPASVDTAIINEEEPVIVKTEEIPKYENVDEETGEIFDFDAIKDFSVYSSVNDVDDKNDEDDVIEIDSSIEQTIKDEIEEDEIPEFIRPMEKVKKEKNMTEVEKAGVSMEIQNAIEVPQKPYIFPKIDFLSKPKNTPNDSRKEMYETANKLIEILKNFGVEAKLLQVTQGPSVTRYEIQPSTGVKLSKITGLADDLALNLAVSNVLVAAVPGKAAVGIEVPNKEVSSVYIRELIDSNEFRNSKSKLSVAFGKDIGGRIVIGDIAKMPHVLIAGATGSGKSVCINTIITSILYKAKPEEVKLIMIDPKVVELGVYNGIPHLLIPVVTDPKKAAGALNWGVQEMMKRYDLFAQTGVRNLEGYNNLMSSNGEERLPQIVIIIDELADLMMVAAKEVEDYVCRLAQLARAAGIHLVIATQRPSVDVITGLIKANVPSRIAFSVSSQVDSRTILDKGGAEKLLGKGDMLYFPTGVRAAVRVQGAFVSDNEIENIVECLKENTEDSYYSEDLADHIERCAIGENGVTPDEEDDGDVLLPKAIELAAELGQISTAMIQRRLKVGYSRAGRIIDQMEFRKLIGPPNGSKPRQVYVNRSDLIDIE